MKCSIVMASYNRGWLLDPALESIRAQSVSFDYEVIVVDDGSQDNTREVCEKYGVTYFYLDRPYACGPAAARNVGYRAARGEVIIAQSSDVKHAGDDTIQRLVETLEPRTFTVARVDNQNEDGTLGHPYTGLSNKRPLFFLGSVLRRDVYAIGGDDEDFTMLGCEDDWFADRLIHGRGLTPVYREDIRGLHQFHGRAKADYDDRFAEAQKLLRSKREAAIASGEWVASGGAWAL